MKLYVLNTGTITMDQSNFTPGKGMGISTTVPLPAFLITHPKGNVLFDTGSDPRVATDLRGTWPLLADCLTVQMTEQNTIVSQLASLGFKPADIKLVVLSHLHIDHAGGIRFLPEAEFVVQKKEIRSAYWPESNEKSVYERADFDHPVKYRDIEGDYDLFGDGKLVLWSTPGHSQGHQSLVVDLANTGKVILCADACYEAANMDRLIPSGVGWCAEETIRSIKRLRDARDKGAMVLFGHDPVQWTQVKQAPAFYN